MWKGAKGRPRVVYYNRLKPFGRSNEKASAHHLQAKDNVFAAEFLVAYSEEYGRTCFRCFGNTYRLAYCVAEDLNTSRNVAFLFPGEVWMPLEVGRATAAGC
ncbi:unnamed protein product [Acanthoscelides obtectus]|uniref:Uncharacterized protein n=1 Tax=Acanthoscelides obtectus TaxID=200917 RepID=A0A9P0KQL8_ACAOB|nr:unnamed protein product [Acanthoscelides obtectus]CAK1671887.1 hypothetical protein AOBTE_LOCUS28521 [Acanthoscelides obtectus]